MLNIDVDELRRKTREAIEKGNKNRAEILAEEQRKAKEKKEADEEWADSVIRNIPYRCEKAAENESNETLVVKVEDYSIKSEKYEDMPYRVKLVWDACVKAGLTPKWLSNWDGGGMSSWYELWVKW